MKILVVHNRYQHWGGEDVVFDQECAMLRNAGHEVVTYLRTNDDVAEFTGMRRLELVPQTIWASDSRAEFETLVRREKPDLVHVHNTFIMISPAIFSVCEKAGIPVVQTLHNFRLMCPAATFFRNGHVCEDCPKMGLWEGIRHGCYKESRSATAVVASMIAVHRKLGTWTKPLHFYIALTQFSRQKFIEAGLPPERIFVKPNFVDPDPGGTREKDIYAVYAGRLSPEKCVDALIEGWECAKSRFPLVILGGGPEREKLEQMVRARKLDGVLFRGQVPRAEVINNIRRARFLLFSSEYYENFPVTLAEAFACGTPVICARMGAMQEIVSDGRTGLHYKPKAIDDLAEKMDWAWTHPKRMDEMGREARQDYETKYTAATNYEMMMEIYERVIGKR